ncbi:MAG: hypothetical protein V2A79_14865 [Planctomycetota bacterium]
MTTERTDEEWAKIAAELEPLLRGRLEWGPNSGPAEPWPWCIGNEDDCFVSRPVGFSLLVGIVTEAMDELGIETTITDSRVRWVCRRGDYWLSPKGQWRRFDPIAYFPDALCARLAAGKWIAKQIKRKNGKGK